MTRVLAIGAHPDDVDLGCGGYLQRFEAKRIVVLSQGEKGGPAAQRVVEQRAAAELFGASVFVYSQPDTAIDLRGATGIIEEETRSFRPDVVLTMAASDTHQDHRITHEATIIACRDLVCTVLAYVGPSSASRFRPSWFVRLSAEEMERKLAALACHRSQAHHPYLGQLYIEGMARYWAMVERCQCQYVEPFECVRRIEP